MTERTPERRLTSAMLKFWPVWLLTLGLVIAFSVALKRHDVPTRAVTDGFNNLFLLAAAWLPMTAILAGLEIARHRPESPLAYLRDEYFDNDYRRNLITFLPIAICLSVFMPNFSAMKSAIPLFAPYTWDPAFIAMDRAIFLGRDAWQVIQPIVGYPIVTAALAGLYHLWILLIYAGSIYMGVNQPDERLRLQYFLAYFLCWTVIGVILAIAFASVGPCFMEYFFGDRTFAPLMEYLHRADEHYPVLVLNVQDILIKWHETGDHGLGRGITAMPSMHISLAVLFWLAMRRISRKAGWFFGAYAVVIFVGSIHTGYHYAVDGIVAAIVTWIIWWLAGLFTRWWTARWVPSEANS